jgi:hypothetical protein
VVGHLKLAGLTGEEAEELFQDRMNGHYGEQQVEEIYANVV